MSGFLINPFVFTGEAPPEGGLPASTVFDLDATISGSYGGSGQTWANLTTSPADGSSQTDYDFWLGVDGSSSSDEPTFNGTAGTSGAYWSFDAIGSGDRFTIAGGNTTFTNNLHKSTPTPSWWMAVTLQNNGTGNFALAGTCTSTGSEVGFTTLVQYVVPRMLAFQKNGITNNTSQIPITYTASDDVLYILTWNGTNYKLYQNNVKTEGVWGANTATSDPTSPLTIGAWPDGSNSFQNGMRLYAVSMGNSYLTDEEAADIKTEYETRHGRTYG